MSGSDPNVKRDYPRNRNAIRIDMFVERFNPNGLRYKRASQQELERMLVEMRAGVHAGGVYSHADTDDWFSRARTIEVAGFAGNPTRHNELQQRSIIALIDLVWDATHAVNTVTAATMSTGSPDLREH